jgi:hypothetical protein
MRPWRSVLLLAVASSAIARDRIALIEFFGYRGLDVELIRQALPVKEGDRYSEPVKLKVREAVKRLIGQDATDVTGICCDEQGDRVLFVGLPGLSNRTFRLNPAPVGSAQLPKGIIELYARLDEAERTAALVGGAAPREEASRGYRLLGYPPAHKLELEVRRYAIRHEHELITVLENCAMATQREIAADALGYAKRSPEQIAALVHACRDPDESVRDRTTRALGDLVSADPALAELVPADVFVEMIGSGVWTDRNKASFVLEALARRRDQRLVAQMKSQAWESLMEMARWRDTGHASVARMILGRIVGMPEDGLIQLGFGSPKQFLEVLDKLAGPPNR